MRFSTWPGDLLNDSVSTPRGVALKMVGVEGPRLPGTEDDVTQDFVMVNAPASAALKALTGQSVDVNGNPDTLRTAVIEHFASQGGEWELQVQLNTGLETMPIEDASVAWPEDRSPYVTVARLSVPAQNAWSDEARSAVDEGLSFGPWHGLAAHRPLGGVNRARKDSYRNSAAFRGSHNGCPMQEPRTGEFVIE